MDTAGFLRERGIQPSPQRVRIYDALAATRLHPSADAIHRALSPELPTLSRTTVYATLELFAESGIAQRLAITGTELRFDADIRPHLHFHCRLCGAVRDLEGRVPPLPAPPPGYLAEGAQLYITGLCPDCRRRSPSRPA